MKSRLLFIAMLLTTIAAHADEEVIGRILNRQDKMIEIQSTCVAENTNPCAGYKLTLVYNTYPSVKQDLSNGNVFIKVPEHFAKKFRKARRAAYHQLMNSTLHNNPVDLFKEYRDALDYMKNNGNMESYTQAVWDGKLPLIAKIPLSSLSIVADVSVDALALSDTIVMEIVRPVLLGSDETLGLISSWKVAKAVENLLGKGGSTTLSDENFQILVQMLNQ